MRHEVCRPWPMRRLSLWILTALSLTGCACPLVPRSETFDRMAGEVRKGVEQPIRPQPSAAEQAAINAALLPPVSLPLESGKRPLEPRFDLAVSNTPVSQVLQAMVAGTRYSLLMPPDLAGDVSLNLKDVTVRDVLDALRDVYGYEYSLRGQRITVRPNTIQTRLFQVSYLASKRGGTSSTRVSSSSMSGGSGGAASGATAGGAVASTSQVSESANVFTGVVHDFWFDLGHALATVLQCEFEITSAASAGQPSGASLVGQLLGQRMDKLRCPDGRNFMINGQSGVVMVRALPTELREVERLIKALQANIERQVMIEAKIIEVELSDEFRTGINWAAFNKQGNPRWSANGNTDVFRPAQTVPGGVSETVSETFDGALVRQSRDVDVSSSFETLGPVSQMALTGATGILKSFPVPGALGLAFQSSSFAALINFLQTQGTLYVLSSPRIATLNNQKAVIKVGSDDYFITAVTPPSTTTTSGGSGQTSYNPPTITTQPFFSGVALDVTPQIDDQGGITLHIRPSVTSVSERDKNINFGSAGGQFTVPYATSRVKESDSIVRVRDGMIVAIGGLMSESQSGGADKVPGMGDVPLLGHFFKQTERSTRKRELVILLKPTLIREESDWRNDLDAVDERLQEYDPRRFKPAPDPFGAS